MSGGTPAISLLDKGKFDYSLHPYKHDARAESYGSEAADALGVEPHRLFKTLIVSVLPPDSVPGGLVCAVVPVIGSLDLKLLAAAVGAKRAELADPMRAQRATGYVVGGISPLGQKSRLPVVVDESARSLSSMFVSAGRRGLQVELAPADLIAATKAQIAAIAAP